MSVKHKSYNTEHISNSVKEYLSGRISYFESIGSTNAWLLENGECGDVCISEAQTDGRGRRGNSWESPGSGNVYLSYCYCLEGIAKHRSLLGLVTGISIAEALEDIGLSGHGIKWPNDIFWQRKKLGGILIETSNKSEKFTIGIGLNLNLAKEYYSEIKQAVVSLEDAMRGKVFCRDELVIHLIQRLSDSLKNFGQMNFDEFVQSWKKWDILRGEAVSFQHQGSLVTGKVVELDKYGRLGVFNENGKIEFFSSAEIRLNKKIL